MPDVVVIIASGLLLLGCDGIRTRKQEREFIWRRPIRLTVVRCLFILARYLAIMIHSVDITLAFLVSLAPVRAPHDLCMSMVLFRAVSFQTMLLVLHLILMLRVFALYNQNLRMGVFLLVLIVIAFAGSTGGMIQGFMHADIEFDGPCFPKKITKNRRDNPMVILACKELFVQLLLHGLTWKRTVVDLRQIRTPAQPQLFSVLNRDGLRVFAGIFVGLVAIGVSVYKRGTKPSVFIFPLLIAFISVSGTRTILNLQTLSTSSDAVTNASRKEIELTVIEGVTEWDGPWDTSTILSID